MRRAIPTLVRGAVLVSCAVIVTGITATSGTFPFIGTQPGRWRAFAVDSLGRPGLKSPWRAFVQER